MNSPLPHARMSALAYLYDNIHDLPNWFRHLAPRQLEEIAGVMVQWQLPNESHCILPIEEIERREILRAVALYGGDAIKAAEALKIGKTTIYRKLSAWGYAVRNRSLLAQASALAAIAKRRATVADCASRVPYTHAEAPRNQTPAFVKRGSEFAGKSRH